MSKLNKVYSELKKVRNNSSYLLSKPIEGFDYHKLAINEIDAPVFLIKIFKRENESDLLFNQDLYNIHIKHNVLCQITIEDDTTEDTFTIISYSGYDDILTQYFLGIGDVLFENLSQKPSIQEVSGIINNFLELFKALKQPPSKSIQGLWGELFIISIQSNPTKLIDAWHNEVSEKFDFSFSNYKIEVKTSSQEDRIHHFNIHQLVPTINTKIYIASIMVRKVPNGKNIQELVELIKNNGVSKDSIKKLKLIIMKTLKSPLDKFEDSSYDFNYALDNIKIFNSNSIPKIIHKQIPSQVSDVSFKSNLNSIKTAHGIDIHCL